MFLATAFDLVMELKCSTWTWCLLGTQPGELVSDTSHVFVWVLDGSLDKILGKISIKWGRLV